MLTDLPLFRLYGALAQRAAESHRVSSENIVHAGQPGYKAQAVESFDAYLARAAGAVTAGERAAFRTTESDGPAAPNGNTVNLEQEVFRSAEALGEHELAVTVYTKSLDLLRSALGRR